MSTAVRHKTDVMARAIELHAAEWKPGQIPRILDHEFGVRPSRDTILRWVDPSYAEKVRTRMRGINTKRWAALWRFNLLERATPECQAAFMRRLDEQDLAATSIAKVCTIVFGEPVSRHRVAKTLGQTT